MFDYSPKQQLYACCPLPTLTSVHLSSTPLAYPSLLSLYQFVHIPLRR